MMSEGLRYLTPLIGELRLAEPAARAFFIFGSVARGEAGPYSDLDLRVITDSLPVERDRVHFVEEQGRLLHISIGARSLDELLAQAREPSAWAGVAGFVPSRVLDDPDDRLAVLEPPLPPIGPRA